MKHSLRIGATVCAAAMISVPAHAQPAVPDSAIDRIFARFSEPNSPGCAVGVSRHGQVVLERGYGLASLEFDVPITPASIFHMASISKQFTAMALMLLERDGVLSLDDDVRRWVPELPDLGERITLRQLLQHTSGVRDQWDLLFLTRGRFEENRITEADVLEILSRQRALNFAPGTDFSYSNSGYTLAAVVVQRASGKSLKDFAQERIFTPLGMSRTHFHDSYTMVVKGRTLAYAPVQGGGGTMRMSLPNYDTYGATSLYSTVGDLLRWQANFERPVVGSPELFAEMQRTGVLASGDSTGYGLGVSTERHRDARLVGHGGADAGYRSYTGRFPEHGLAVAVACNLANVNPAGLAREVADLYLEDGLAPAPSAVSAEANGATPPIPTAEVARRAGVYESDAGRLVYLRAKGAALALGRLQGPDLVPAGPDRFRVPNGPELLFVDGMTLELRPAGPYGATERFTRREPVTYTAEQLRAYAGEYYSAELGASYTVTASDTALALRTRGGNAAVVTPVFEDMFDGQYRVRFLRDASGRIDGMLLSTGRVWRIRFDRAPASAPAR